MAPVMWSCIYLMVSIGHALTWSGQDGRRSQLLPTEKTFSIGFKLGEHSERSSTTIPASLAAA